MCNAFGCSLDKLERMVPATERLLMLGYTSGARPEDGLLQSPGLRIGTSLSGDNCCLALGRWLRAGRKPVVL